MKNKWSTYKKALKLWGLPFQIIMLGEEQGELFKTVSKLNRRKNNTTANDVAEEIADNEIMMEQMQVAFSIPRRWIDGWKARKIKALEKIVKSKMAD